MKAFIVAGAVAAATLGLAGTADAQVGYNTYRTYNPYTGTFVTGQVAYTPFGAQNVQTVSNPFTGFYRQAGVYQDPFGNTYGQRVQYNPFTNLGYSSGFYNPGLYSNPYLGYRYGHIFR